MIKDATYASLLFDFYGKLLPEKQEEVMIYYHEDNLSLSEIAENLNITRQGVHYILKSAEKTLEEHEKKVRGEAGIKALLGTTDMRKVEENINNGDEYSKFIYSAMAYKVAKAIGGMAATLNFDLDCIILTGGIAYSEMIDNMISDRINKIAPIIIVPGEFEMEALVEGAIRIINGEEEAKTY